MLSTKLNCGTLYFMLNLQDNPSIRLVRSLNETEEPADKRSGPAGSGGEKYIETLVVVDPKMANFHGEDAAKQYALATCNIVSFFKVIYSTRITYRQSANEQINF